MREWQAKWPEARPRWGTYSVRAHTDLRQLIADALLYDVLVFPCVRKTTQITTDGRPKAGNPELLALRITQFGDAAVTVPWDTQLRDTWAYRYNQLTEEQRQDPDTCLRPHVLAALHGLVPHPHGTGRRPPHRRGAGPAAESTRATRSGTGDRAPNASSSSSPRRSSCHGRPSPRARLTQLAQARRDRTSPTRARVRLRLAVPEDADEAMLHRTLDTIGDADFQHVRRRLWSWKEDLPDNVEPQEAQLRLEALVEDYNAAVRRQIKGTRLKTVFLIVPVGAWPSMRSRPEGWCTRLLAPCWYARSTGQGALPAPAGCGGTG